MEHDKTEKNEQAHAKSWHYTKDEEPKEQGYYDVLYKDGGTDTLYYFRLNGVGYWGKNKKGESLKWSCGRYITQWCKTDDPMPHKDPLHFSPKFGRKVIEMQMLLLSKQVAWKGEELNNLYDYVFKKYIECMADVLTCHEDNESLEFLILMTEHAVQVVMGDLSFLSCYAWYGEIVGLP